MKQPPAPCRPSAPRALILAMGLAFGAVPVSAQESGTVVVANMSDDTVTLVDAASRRVAATLPSGPAPHEVAVSASGEWAVVTNYGNRNSTGRSLTLIHVPEARVEATYDMGIYERPHGVAFLPGDTLVAVTSEARQSLIFVDIRSGEVVDTLSTTQRTSHMLTASPDGRSLFTTNIVDGTITEFDGVQRSRGRVINVAPMVEGLAVSPSGDRVWVGSNANKEVLVMDVATGEVDTTYAGFGFPYRMAVTPNGALTVLSDPGRSEIRIVDAQTLKHLKTIHVSGEGSGPAAEFPNSANPEGLIITPDSRYAYVSLQAMNQVAVVDLEHLEIIGRLDVGGWPDGIGYSIRSAQVD